MKNPIFLLRIVGLVEGVSFLLLLGIAMPLKYLADIPIAVQVAGWVHGALFIALCLALLRVLMITNWPMVRAIQVFIAALVPLGPFFIDQRMRQWEAQFTPQGP